MIFLFLPKKKQKNCQRVSRTHHSLHRLLVARAANLSSCNRDLLHYLIHFGVLFLYEWHVYGGSTWFGSELLFFHSFPSLSSLIFVPAMQKFIPSLQFIFYFD
jgi:hypothetical protein